MHFFTIKTLSNLVSYSSNSKWYEHLIKTPSKWRNVFDLFIRVPLAGNSTHILIFQEIFQMKYKNDHLWLTSITTHIIQCKLIVCYYIGVAMFDLLIKSIIHSAWDIYILNLTLCNELYHEKHTSYCKISYLL